MEGEYQAFNSEDYADLIVYYLNNPESLSKFTNSTIEYMNEAFAVVHIPVAQITDKTVSTFGYAVMPKVYGLTSEQSLEASGVDRLRNIPGFNLRGSGVLIGIIDSGIDYTNPVFLKPDGSTKIITIWDQTVSTGNPPQSINFGTEYNSEQINLALSSEDPYSVVSSTDEIGHGTMMAGIAAGSEVPGEGFAGVAPEAELVIVKLRRTKKYLCNYYVIPEDVNCYQENHIMWGVQYCSQMARMLNRPIVILTGVGSSQGSHDGRSYLSIFMSIIGDLPNTAVVTPIGNEGNRGRHFYAAVDTAVGYSSVELNVGEKEYGFTMELWGNAPGIYTVDFLTPTGEYISKLPAGIRMNREISFLFEKTKIMVDYQVAESQTGEQLILMRFRNITPGIWRFNVYSRGNLPSGFHIWLPMGNMIQDDTYFVQADNNTTVLSPGSAVVPITITAYDITNDSLYAYASRGYDRNNTVKPELAAPGVNYIAPDRDRSFKSFTGSSAAAAHAAGIAAMVLEWGTVKGNHRGLDCVEVKNYLIRGAVKIPNQPYPNKNWGYGRIDIFHVFDVLRLETGDNKGG